MSTTYILSESKPPSTGYGWSKQSFHIMIISVYIWAQLTDCMSESESPSTVHGFEWAKLHIMIISHTNELNLQPEWIRVTVHRAWLEWAMFSHHDHWSVCIYEHNLHTESPSTGNCWNEQGFHIMIISVYIWAQLTVWVNPSYRPQGMVGVSKVFTSWSLISMYIWEQLTYWVTVHRAWLEWARFSHHDHQCVHMSTTYSLSESESPSTGHGWNEQGFHMMIISVYMSTTYRLSESESPSTGHGWNEQSFSHHDHQRVHEHNLQSEWIRVTVHRAWLEWAKVFTSWSSACTWTQLTIWVNPSHRPQGMVGMSKVFISLSSISMYIWAQLTYWVNPSHRPQGMIGMDKVFTLWLSISVYIWAQLTCWVHPSCHPQGMVGMGRVFTLL